MRRFLLPWFAVLALGLCGAAPAQQDSPALDRGRRLFHGELPLPGQITGHGTPLPAQASRCVNCHALESAAAAASASAPSFAPLLGPRQLTSPAPRRGGPPSRYDEAGFCRLLRSGVDPAYIVIERAMPRYEMPAADCRALWIYLTSPVAENGRAK